MSVLGHSKVLNFLRKSIENNTLAHAYLFCGEAHLGKMRVAKEFAKMLTCRKDLSDNSLHDTSPCQTCRDCQDIEKGMHPDVILLSPQDHHRIIPISHIRELRRILSLSPYNSKFKIAIIDEAHQMNLEASNAILKTLEEPRGNAILILCTGFPELLPETVISRVQIIRFHRVQDELIRNQLQVFGLEPNLAEKITKLSQGRPGMAFLLAQDQNLLTQSEIKARGLFGLFNEDLLGRFQYPNIQGSDKKSILENLEVLLEIMRGMLLAKLDKEECSNLDFQGQLRKRAENLSFGKILENIKFLQRLKSLEETFNLNPKLGFEIAMLKL